MILLTSACDAPLSTPKPKDTPETRKMLNAFAKQQHRFEFSGCDMQYNGEQFNINMSIQELKSVFGPTSRELPANARDKNNAYYWFDNKVRVLERKEEKILRTIGVEFRNTPPQDSPFLILIEGTPLDNVMTMGGFIENSTRNYGDFYISSSSYELKLPKCDHPIRYYFSSKVNFSYIGNGHMRLKDKPDFETTFPVSSFEIYPYKK